MSEILSVNYLNLDDVEPDGTSHWSVRATVSDAVLAVPARCYPADIAHPDEHGSAECISYFQLEADATPPPINGTSRDLQDFIEALDLDWDVDDDV